MPAPPRRQRPHRPAPQRVPPALQPLDERELEAFQALLDRIPAPFEPLDVSMIDGFLCGVLVQPQPVPVARWLPRVSDVDGRPLPDSPDAERLRQFARRRHAELDDAIGRRQWFDPWVFELDAADGGPPDGSSGDDGADASPIDAVYPWVAGIATALELFPALLQRPAAALTEPLALLYRHFAPDDLEDADDLLAEIDSLEPPADLADAVEGLVRATLLLADIGRPVGVPNAGGRHARSAAGAAPKNPSPRRPAPRGGSRGA